MRISGTVKCFSQATGYGFVTPDDAGKDVFVHVSAIEGADMQPLHQGVRISFELKDDRRGRGKQSRSAEAR